MGRIVFDYPKKSTIEGLKQARVDFNQFIGLIKTGDKSSRRNARFLWFALSLGCLHCVVRSSRWSFGE